ncbi:hypothetical protein [Desulfovibrio ferrophilus]|uniref:Lipoprotein n=1 Tax=Desulfovibrio ferrophilus TaxID=241368 RepID=A0A2Z6AUC1_9BACT|nr:hypothetical protein [Desulfovibrio ferrophilus]BBD06827.1 hypothetical protein DFE_0101 [Desulfovibrio ferrophilus]
MRILRSAILGFVFAVVMLSTGCLLGSKDWAEGTGGTVPDGASTVANGMYAVRVKVEVPGGKAWYPGVLKAGEPAMVCRHCLDGSVETASQYQVYLPLGQWKQTQAGMALPQDAVEFGDDDGELYLVRAQLTLGGEYAYGMLSEANLVPYVYNSNIWAPVPECEVLCAVSP